MLFPTQFAMCTAVYEVHIPAEELKEEDNVKATKAQDVSMYCS